MLLGRDAERRRIEELLAQARLGTSGVLALRGEPGIGKTALLHYAEAAAGDATVLRARGLESEIEVPFGGLFELLRPVLDRIDDVPAPLAAALGLDAAAPAEHRLVGAALLTVLGALGEQRPVVVLVDDVQWLDGPSATALTFAVRRLLADAVAVVIAVREGEGSPIESAGFEELRLGGLEAADARALLADLAGRPIAQDTATWLHAATGGNPLALVELADEAPRLRPGPVDARVAVGERTARAVGRRLDRLNEEADAALLVAAVADAEAIEPVLAAGASLAGLEAAETAGLVTLSPGRITFRHPLVRSVVLDRAGRAAVRAAHRAFAGALDPEADADRRAWHTAAGTVAPDEEVAAALATVGARAAARGGHATAAAALLRAARLTPDRALSGERLRAAADATWLAGDGPGALALLDEAAALPLPTAARAAAAHLRGRVLWRRGALRDAVEVLRDAAESVADTDPGLSAEMLAEAAYATAGYAMAGDEMDRLAARAYELAPADEPRAVCMATMALGAVLVLRGRPEAARHLDEASALIDATPELQNDPHVAAFLGIPAAFRRAPAEAYEPLHRAVALARRRGAVGVLPFALFYVGAGALASPRWADAAAAFGEAVRLAREVDLPVDEIAALAGLARLEARRGSEDAGAHAAEALERSAAAGIRLFESWALHALGDAAWGRGDVDGAIAAFERKEQLLAEHGVEDPDLSPAPELVELLLQRDRRAEAAERAAAAVVAAERKGKPWALARARRAAALVEPDSARALARLQEALELHELEADVFERARTQLCLGERLRRDGRRADARAPLRAALAAFEDLGARPWAERASAELAATGETVRRRDPSTLDDLTAQELRIALMLADGASTREAASALYLSPKTIEYHLRHVYLKLGINSRGALKAALRPDHSSAEMSSAARAAPPSATGR